MSFLNIKGYNKLIDELSCSEFEIVKKELTVEADNFLDNTKTKRYKLYSINKKKNLIITPKHYGIKKWGIPKSLKYKPEKCKINFTGTLREKQKIILDEFMPKMIEWMGGVLAIPPGEGKCLAPGTKIKLFDGNIKKVENLNINDKLIGDDNNIRNIKKLSTGFDDMFKVSYIDNDFSYTVNGEHILTLYDIKNNIFKDISVFDYHKLNNNEKNNYKGIRVNKKNNYEFLDFKINYSHYGKHYGFIIDKNGRFQLEDGTITHNTIMAIYQIAYLGLKTLVLTDSKGIMTQWKTRIEQVSDARVGIIREKIFDIENKDIVIATVQTLRKNRITANDLKSFGFLIVDEAPGYASSENCKSLKKSGCKYSESLSATPYRSDGLFKVIKWFTGDIIYYDKFKVNPFGVVKFINFFSTNKQYKPRKLRKGGRLITNTVGTNDNVLSKCSNRNKAIADILKEFSKDSRRKIIVLCRLKNNLYDLKNRLDKSIPKINVNLFTGELSTSQREKIIDESQILLATTGIAEKALDIPTLNTIIIATPIKDPIQCTGRVFRTVLCKGDPKPVIIDITDHIDSTYLNWKKDHNTYYKKCKYDCENIFCIDGNIVEKDYFYDVSKSSPVCDDYCSDSKNFLDALKVDDVPCDMNESDVIPIMDDDDDNDDNNNEKIKENSKKCNNRFRGNINNLLKKK